MVYVTVKEASEDKLHLVREPTARSWAIFVGLVSLGLGAAYYSGDYLFWKLAYVSGTVFVGLTCLEDWEECILDKSTRKITIKRSTLVQKLFHVEKGQKIVVDDLDGCISVSVEDEEVKYAGIGYIVVLHFSAGYSLGVTETAVISDKSDHEQIADKISSFLGVDRKSSGEHQPFVGMHLESSDEKSCEAEGAASATTLASYVKETPAEGSTSASPVTEKQSSTDESDDSFEQIDKEELVNINEVGQDREELPKDESGSSQD